MAQLSDDDLIHLVGGQPNTGVGNVFGFGNIPEYAVPNAQTADGPAGVRILPETGVETTAFPCATLIACTWNRDIAQEIGCAGGEELKENNLCVWLTPAINIHRNPMCGRNFEYYSEDPLVSGKIAAAVTKGVQKHQGCSVAIKHFACNNQETNRFHSNSIVSERALRDIYLKGFKITVQEAKPQAVMTSYNLLNGEHTSQRADLIQQVLRKEWGFKGIVMSDWVISGIPTGKVYKYPLACASGSIKAGNDIMMPGSQADYDDLMKAFTDLTHP
jgi:beta-glucosidase